MSSRSTQPPVAQAAPAAAQGAETDIRIELPDREPVPARLYGVRPRGTTVPLVLHFHGGTFVCGDLDNGRSVARLLAGAGAVVVSLDYPLAPKAPFPEPIEVGFAALEWLHKQRVKLAGKGAQVFLAGEEAGGNLAAAVALMARDRAHPPLAGQILLSPMLDPCAATPRSASGPRAGRSTSSDRSTPRTRMRCPAGRCGWPRWRRRWCWSARTTRCATRR